MISAFGVEDNRIAKASKRRRPGDLGFTRGEAAMIAGGTAGGAAAMGGGAALKHRKYVATANREREAANTAHQRSQAQAWRAKQQANNPNQGIPKHNRKMAVQNEYNAVQGRLRAAGAAAGARRVRPTIVPKTIGGALIGSGIGLATAMGSAEARQNKRKRPVSKSAFGIEDDRVSKGKQFDHELAQKQSEGWPQMTQTQKNAPAEVHVEGPVGEKRGRRLKRVLVIGSAGGAGGLAGAGASKLHRNKVNPKVVLGGAAIGSGVTGVRAYRDAKREREGR